jgi:hypothetical protein
MTGMRYLRVKNFEQFQHYKAQKGKPRWIKLYSDLLTDYDFQRLPDSAKAHLTLIWLLYSQVGKLPYDSVWIGKHIGATDVVDLKVLVDSGFLVVEGDESALESTHMSTLEHSSPSALECSNLISSSLSSVILAEAPKVTPPSELEQQLKESIKQVQKRKRAETSWPFEFSLSPDMRAYATERGIDANQEFTAWEDDCAAHDRRYCDWEAAWRTRIRNAVSWGRPAQKVAHTGSVGQAGLRLTPAVAHLMQRISEFKAEKVNPEKTDGQGPSSRGAEPGKGLLPGPGNRRPDPKGMVSDAGGQVLRLCPNGNSESGKGWFAQTNTG